MKVHQLKTWPEPFDALRFGIKRYEVRKNDRNFQVGDVLELRCWDPEDGVETGDSMRFYVAYMTCGGEFGLPEDLVVMSLQALAAD